MPPILEAIIELHVEGYLLMDSLSLKTFLKYHWILLESLKRKDALKLKKIVKNHWPGWSKN